MNQYIRWLAYASPVVYKIIKRFAHNSQNKNPDFWNRELSGSKISYLDVGFQTHLRNVLIGELCRAEAGGSIEVLDVGCASGELLESMPESDILTYIGIDISFVAIDYARQRFSGTERRCTFVVSDLCGFDQGKSTFDAIVFNEILYYLDCDDVCRELNRYSLMLKPGGQLYVSMKNDPKSRLIYRLIERNFDCVKSLTFQVSPSNSTAFRVQYSRESPAYTIAAFKPRTAG